MSFDPDLHLGNLHLIFDRPGATPAPTGDDVPPATPDNPIPSRLGPCTRTNEQMSADARAVVDDVWRAIGRSRRARGADEPQRRAA